MPDENKLDIKSLEAHYDNILKQKEQTQKTLQNKPDVSYLESLLRGSAQGLSFGGSEEITGGVESLLSNKSYEQARDEAREKNRLAQEANPITYTLGEIGGAVAPTIASAFIPGGQAGTAVGAANIATKAPTLLRLAGMGAGQGALSGLGYSEGQNASEIAQDVATGGAMGAVIPAGLKGLSKIPTAKIADTTIKKGLQGGLGVSSELLTEAEKNPKAVKKILDVYAGENIKKDIIPERAAIVERFMTDNPIAKRAISNSQKAVQSIPDDVKISPQIAIDEIDKQIAFLGKSKGVSDVRNQAIKMLEDKKSAFIALGDNVEGRDLKPILQGLDLDIEAAGGWQNPLKNNSYRDGLEKARQSLDRELKNQVPEYDRLMKKVAKDYKLSNNLTKQFATKEGFDENKIASTLNAQLRKGDTNLKSDFKRLEAFGRASGNEDLALNEFLKDMALKQSIEQYGGKGSSISNRLVGLSTMAGTTLGGLPGGVIGTGLGSVAGSEAEKRGGHWALKALEATKGIRTPSTGIADRSLQNISNATTRGGTTLLNDFLSQQRSEVNRKKAMQERGANR
jgi:hypothetical protein